MGQESSLLPRNPYENYPNKSNHQKLLISDSEDHYCNLTKFHKSKSNLSSSISNNSISTESTHLRNHHYQENHSSPRATYVCSYSEKSLSSSNNNINRLTVASDKIPIHLPPPPPLPPSTNRYSAFAFDRYQKIKKSTSRSSFASYTDYSTCYCSSNSSALSSASKKSQEKQVNYLNHHLYIKSYLDILEEDEKAKRQFKPRPGIRNYKPKILSSTSLESVSCTSSRKEKKSKEPDIWI